MGLSTPLIIAYCTLINKNATPATVDELNQDKEKQILPISSISQFPISTNVI